MNLLGVVREESFGWIVVGKKPVDNNFINGLGEWPFALARQALFMEAVLDVLTSTLPNNNARENSSALFTLILIKFTLIKYHVRARSHNCMRYSV